MPRVTRVFAGEAEIAKVAPEKKMALETIRIDLYRAKDEGKSKTRVMTNGTAESDCINKAIAKGLF